MNMNGIFSGQTFRLIIIIDRYHILIIKKINLQSENQLTVLEKKHKIWKIKTESFEPGSKDFLNTVSI